MLQFSRHVNTGEPRVSSSALEYRGSIHPLSADRGNEGRRVANCTDSRRFSVSRRSLQHPLPRRLALLVGGSTPLSTTTATATPAFSASASAFVQTLPYPNSYPRKHGYVHPGPGRREISRFTTSSCGFHGLRVYVARGSTVRFFPSFFLFFSSIFFFFFFSYATRSVKRSRDPSANCNDSSSLFLFFYSCPVPLILSTASFHRSPFLHAPNACGPSLEFFLLSQEEIETYTQAYPRRDF